MKDVDDLAYRMWSIHPSELDKMTDLEKRMPDDYPGGLRAFFFATEMAKLIEKYALQNAREANVAWSVCQSSHRDFAKKSDAMYTTRQNDYIKNKEKTKENIEKISSDLAKYINI
ncbi:hypothetical protein FDI40_gp643 [Agrobacterium phage Atu_ph07]|uniref:Uncharacterized protein n=1 Tax=Agrobacterium phage Atu_ph07 TaxID=2024264 RepID=A0A2L0V0Q2_9CAUD|nr:hypothetical protein FDI40_gp643 [Agrobacterium phage Atu_ph07]AUZ95402.1 hypothetical protein [Agrobacterium phage Atu_ph07]